MGIIPVFASPHEAGGNVRAAVEYLVLDGSPPFIGLLGPLVRMQQLWV